MSERKTISILVGQASEYYQAAFITGFQERAFEFGYDVLVFSMYDKYQNKKEREIGESSIFELVPYDRTDAFILLLDTIQTPGVAGRIEEMIKERSNAPVLVIEKDSSVFKSVKPNHYEGVKALISHLIEEHGYTDIVFLSGKSWHPYSKERTKAYMDALEEHNIPVDKKKIFYGDFWYSSGENLGDKLVKSGHLPQAVACANDCMAIGLAKALLSMNVRIPEDVAIVGYDSNDEGKYAPIPVTSVTVPARDFGIYAADSINDMLEGREVRKFEEEPRLFIGGTCGCGHDSLKPVINLRKTWDTDSSSNSIYSPFNHMDEDMLTQYSLYGLMSTIFSYVYQIRDFESFSICLNEGWMNFDKNAAKYSDKMNQVLKCGPHNQNNDSVELENYFDRSELLPELSKDREEPRCYFFTPLYFEDYSFGYAAISYGAPGSYNDQYRIWLKAAMRGLEYFRRQEVLRLTNSKLEASMVREPLTGLYNYRGLLSISEQILRRFRKGYNSIAVLDVDIKDLSKINDTDGRGVGDMVIVNMAKFLQNTFEKGFTFCIGNGEFIVIFGVVTDRNEDVNFGLLKLYELIDDFNQMNDSFRNLEFYYGIELGMPVDKEDLEALISMAVNRKNIQKSDMTRIRESGILSEKEQKDARIVHEILDKNILDYHFQPIIDARTGDIFAYEALMRTDQKINLSPADVLRYAEYFNRLYDVEKATFGNVKKILETRSEVFADGSKIFINSIPGHQLVGEDAKTIEDIAREFKNRIVVELTEQTELMDEALSDMKQHYQTIGVETAVDDYGTGYSNISNLLRYMPNYVKIDRVLLSDINTSPQKQHFVKDIISFSHDNNILALAEGIETYEEFQTLIRLGVDLIQGYYVARPTKEVIKEIKPEIRSQIKEIMLSELESKQRNVYVAGRENRVPVHMLAQEERNVIKVVTGETNYRDFSLAGTPGMETDIGIVIDDGYCGRIELENCIFTGSKVGYAVDIGENCEVTIILKGDNRFEGVGIRVPQSSSLVLEGDGDLSITINEMEGFAIGNGMNSKHGDLVFDQDGTIDIQMGGASGVAIASGLGGNIKIMHGRYNIKTSGKEFVGIGALKGNSSPYITNCYMEMKNSALKFVGIGSMYGKADVKIERITAKMNDRGEETVLFGTADGKECKVSFFSAYCMVTGSSSKLMAIGSFESKKVDLSFLEVTLSARISGGNVSIMGNLSRNAEISIDNCFIEGELVSDNDGDFMTEERFIRFEKARSKIIVNGHEFQRVAE